MREKASHPLAYRPQGDRELIRHKEKGRHLSDALSSRFRGKSGAHPNPVRIQMLSSATVKRNRYRSRLQPLDHSGATLGSWLPAICVSPCPTPCVLKIRVNSSLRASLRCRGVSSPRAGLQLARCSRRFRLPGSRNAFRLFVRGRTAQVRPCA